MIKFFFTCFLLLSYDWWITIVLSSYTASVLFLMHYLKSLLPDFKRLPIFHWYTGLCILYILLVTFLPLQYVFIFWEPVLRVIMLFPVIIIPMIIFKVVLSGQRGSIYLFLAIISIGSSTLWGTIKNIYKLEIPYYPFDLIIGVICFVTYWFKQFFDVSKDSQEFAEKLQRMDKQKDDFLANTSHELRNPLHGMINMAQATLDNRNNQLDEEAQRNLRLLISVGQRMSLMLNDLLDITRLKEGENSLRNKQCKCCFGCFRCV